MQYAVIVKIIPITYLMLFSLTINESILDSHVTVIIVPSL